MKRRHGNFQGHEIEHLLFVGDSPSKRVKECNFDEFGRGELFIRAALSIQLISGIVFLFNNRVCLCNTNCDTAIPTQFHKWADMILNNWESMLNNRNMSRLSLLALLKELDLNGHNHTDWMTCIEDELGELGERGWHLRRTLHSGLNALNLVLDLDVRRGSDGRLGDEALLELSKCNWVWGRVTGLGTLSWKWGTHVGSFASGLNYMIQAFLTHTLHEDALKTSNLGLHHLEILSSSLCMTRQVDSPPLDLVTVTLLRDVVTHLLCCGSQGVDLWTISHQMCENPEGDGRFQNRLMYFLESWRSEMNQRGLWQNSTGLPQVECRADELVGTRSSLSLFANATSAGESELDLRDTTMGEDNEERRHLFDFN